MKNKPEKAELTSSETILNATRSDMSRRGFLKTAALVGAAICATPALNKVMAGERVINGNDKSARRGRYDGLRIADRRTLGSGSHALEVSAMGLGMMGMDYHRGPFPDKQAMIRLTRQAVERGVNLFDTAIGYGPHTNEELTGEALEPFKNEVIYGTKFYDGTETQPAALERYIRECLEGSLKRLRIETIDLYYLHRYSGNVPVEEIVTVLQKFMREGKIKHYGLSEVSSETIRRAHAVEPVTALQSEYHLMWRVPEEDILPTCQQLGIGFVPYSPVNRGFLTGAINEYTDFNRGSDNRNILPRFTPEAIRANTRIVEALNIFGRTRGMTAAQVAQAWLLAKAEWIVPITGTTKLAHLEENLRTLDFNLSPSDMTELESAVSAIPIMGDRYPASEQERVGH